MDLTPWISMQGLSYCIVSKICSCLARNKINTVVAVVAAAAATAAHKHHHFIIT